ncbi:D-amino acid oxidase [Exophiala xenobiotica]|uniref:D-amino acid oxidase n=1 Tax=Lithohypha guttulata TaxID=1690604 RepID=A0ABR0K1K7_9EURO|nr:D-amino acid oxidase [Lithohypha guttulata]KAK5312002.1 D-amino acid oxidase [Exophiala xenobiotica]
MTRAAGGGTVLGGCYQKGNWESQHDPSLAIRIMKRCVAMCPKLTDGKGIEHLDVIRHGVGLRPVREGNVARVEKEKINGVWVVGPLLTLSRSTITDTVGPDIRALTDVQRRLLN